MWGSHTHKSHPSNTCLHTYCLYQGSTTFLLVFCHIESNCMHSLSFLHLFSFTHIHYWFCFSFCWWPSPCLGQIPYSFHFFYSLVLVCSCFCFQLFLFFPHSPLFSQQNHQNISNWDEMTDIVITVAAKVSEYLIAPIGHQLSYLFCYRSHMDELDKKIQELGRVRVTFR